MSNPGGLRYRFAVEAPVDGDDGSGGLVRTYQHQSSLWAAMTPVSFSEQVIDGARAGRATHRLRIRAGAVLSLDHRLRLGADRLFRILAYRDGEPGYRLLLVEELGA